VLRGYSVLVQARIATLQQRLTDARALLDGLERLA